MNRSASDLVTSPDHHAAGGFFKKGDSSIPRHKMWITSSDEEENYYASADSNQLMICPHTAFPQPKEWFIAEYGVKDGTDKWKTV